MIQGFYVVTNFSKILWSSSLFLDKQEMSINLFLVNVSFFVPFLKSTLHVTSISYTREGPIRKNQRFWESEKSNKCSKKFPFCWRNKLILYLKCFSVGRLINLGVWSPEELLTLIFLVSLIVTRSAYTRFLINPNILMVLNQGNAVEIDKVHYWQSVTLKKNPVFFSR